MKLRKFQKMAERRAALSDSDAMTICMIFFVLMVVGLIISFVEYYSSPHEDVRAEVISVSYEETEVTTRSKRGAYHHTTVHPAVTTEVCLKNVETGTIETLTVIYKDDDRAKAYNLKKGVIIQYNEHSGLQYYELIEGE